MVVSHTNLVCGVRDRSAKPELRGDVLNRAALENDVQQSNQVHGREHAADDVEAIDVGLPSGGNTHQHERDTELDRNDRGAVENFEEKEPLVK